MSPLFVAVTGALVLTTLPALAQKYPSKPIRMVVPFTPGTGIDIIARTLAQRFSEKWGIGVVVDNKPGANTIVATDNCVKSPPDGYSLCYITSNLPLNASLYSKLPYDAVNDFAPITNLGLTPQTLVVSPSESYKTVKEFVAAAKHLRALR